MASRSGHPTAKRRKKYRNPATRTTAKAADRLKPSVLPEYLRGDDGDQPDGSEEDNDAKRLRSTSTTPRSARGMDLDEYDRVMGISSAQPPERDRFGDGSVTHTEKIEQGVANDSTASTPIVSGLGNCPAGLDSRGYGSASLTECLDRLSRVPNLAAPAACASEGAVEYFRSQPNPRQVVSPNSSQTLPQDPFYTQVPHPKADAKVGTKNSPAKCKEEGSSKPTICVEDERPHESEIPDSNRDTQENFLQVPWIDVMNELRSVQQSCRQLRTQVEGIASNADMSHIVAFSRGISRIEDGVWFDRNILMREQERNAETTREYQAKVDLSLARIERLTNQPALRTGTMNSQIKKVKMRLIEWLEMSRVVLHQDAALNEFACQLLR